jgi:HK97 family phage prohead protease
MKPNYSPDKLYECPVEFKTAGDGNTVEGYASVFDVVDSYGDVVLHGAFKKTIKDRVSKGLVPFVSDHRWEVDSLLGTIVKADEDSKGLHFEAELSKAPSVQDVKIKMTEGHLHQASFGFRTIGEKFPKAPESIGGRQVFRYLTEVMLLDIAPVVLAANELAGITGVKALVPFQDLPIASRARAWDAPDAEARVREWAGGGDQPSAKYRRAFLCYDNEVQGEYDSYKHQIADIIDGNLTIIPQAVFMVAAALQNANNSPDTANIRQHLDHYYAKMADEFKDGNIKPPWSDGLNGLIHVVEFGNYNLEDIRAASKRLNQIADSKAAEPARPLTAQMLAAEAEALSLELELAKFNYGAL